MKISIAWLSEWIGAGLSPKELGDRLTLAGFELESLTPAAADFSGVRIAEILSADKHPQADKLRVCRVSLGADEPEVQIVCGAANARAGLRAPLALVGAKLPGDLQIRATTLRGVESAGMLCSAKELGLADSSEGLLELPPDAPLGASVRDYLALDDSVLELAITPNRGDAMSVRGIAREAAALMGRSFVEPAVPAITATLDERHEVALEEPAACPRFHSRIVVDVDNQRSSPMWLRERLRRAGLRSISPVVDVTNYVVIELGQPMHAYDLDRIEGSLRVRRAHAGEHCALLDGQTVTLEDDVLVIADKSGPVALAGVMGGARTAVSDTTRRVLFEVAWFAPQAIAGRGRRYGLTTDASQRFERGVDPDIGARAIERATALLLQIAGGRAGPVTASEAVGLPRREALTLRMSEIERVLGVSVPIERVREMLGRIGLIGRGDTSSLSVAVPSHRFDLSIERDLIEEVARLIGYDAIPASSARTAQQIHPLPSSSVPEQRVLDVLSARGYHEGVHLAFVDPVLQERLFPTVPAHRLRNPIASDLAVMRVSLWPGLLKAALENLNRQQTRIRLFEHGVVFPVDAPEVDRLAAIAIGPRWPEQWSGGRERVDVYDLRADLEAVLSLAGASEIRFEAGSVSCLHPGRSLKLLRDGREIGWLGELHPSLVRALGFPQAPVLFELDLGAALTVSYGAFQELSRFPQVRRDLAVVVDESVPYVEIRERVFAAASSLLREIVLFDVYRGKGIESGRKSIALGLILQDKERTLTDEDTDRVMTAVRAALVQHYRASFRE